MGSFPEPGQPVWLVAAASLLLAVVLLAVVRADLRVMRIPDGLSLPLIAVGLMMAAVWPWQPVAHHLIGAGGGFLLLWGIGEAFFRLRGAEGLGIGDAKLFAAAGAWMGWQVLPVVLLIAATGGLLWSFVMQKGGPMPFGPWLAMGFWLCWIVLQGPGMVSAAGG